MKLSDISWAINLSESDAQQGHYLSYPSKEQMILGETARFTSIIRNGLSPQTFPVPDFPARAFVCERKSGTGKVKVGFVTFQKASILPEYCINEIHQISVASVFRGKGIGSVILDHTIQCLSSESEGIYGRCLPDSKIMMSMIERRNFDLAAETRETSYFVRGTYEQKEKFKHVIRTVLEKVLIN